MGLLNPGLHSWVVPYELFCSANSSARQAQLSMYAEKFDELVYQVRSMSKYSTFPHGAEERVPRAGATRSGDGIVSVRKSERLQFHTYTF